MKLEDQVCTLEQAKKLKELGVDQEAFIFHYNDETFILRNKSNPNDWMVSAYAAFTVAELGEMLPTGYDTMRVTQTKGELWRSYDEEGNDFPWLYTAEARARAEVLIHLLEKQIITVDEVNQRLTK